MEEETKEEFLARHRKEGGFESNKVEEDEEELIAPNGFKAKLKGLFFIVLIALFFFGNTSNFWNAKE
jgi:hypothetical protein